MDAAIREKHPGAKIELVEGSGGDFIVDIDGRRVWNKREMNDAFPEERDILELLGT